MAVGRTNAAGKGGRVDLSIVYSDTQPSTDAGELWVKDSAAAKSVYVTPYAELSNYVVTEDTGCVNTTRLYCAGAGSYNGKIYWIAWSGSISSSGTAKLSLYSYNPLTNAITAELSNFVSVRAYDNSSNVIAAQLKGNKFYFATTSSSITLAVLDIDTLTYTAYNGNILDYDSGSSYDKYYFGVSSDGSKLISAGTSNGTLIVYDTLTKTYTSYSSRAASSPQWFWDDGTYIYVVHGGSTKAIYVLSSSDYSVVTTTTALPDYVRACFMVGESIYIGTGVSTIYRLEYADGAISFAHITDTGPEWSASATSTYTQKYGDVYGWSSSYCKNAYAAVGDTLYCICAGGYSVSSNDVPIKRAKFSAAAYAHDALIVTTTGAPKNRTKLVTSDGFNVKINVNKLYKTDNAGNMTEVDGYSKNLAGEWVKI